MGDTDNDIPQVDGNNSFLSCFSCYSSELDGEMIETIVNFPFGTECESPPVWHEYYSKIPSTLPAILKTVKRDKKLLDCHFCIKHEVSYA